MVGVEDVAGGPRQLARALLLCDVEHAPLVRHFEDRIHHLNREFGAWMGFAGVGDYRHSSPEFRAEIESAGLKHDPLAETLRAIERYRSIAVARQHETAQIVERLGLSFDDLPCIVMAVLDSTRPLLLVHIPRTLACEAKAREVIEMIRTTFSTEFLSQTAKLTDPKAVYHAFEEATRCLEQKLRPGHASAVAPAKQRGDSEEAELRWQDHALALLVADPAISKKQLAEAVGVSRATLYRDSRVRAVLKSVGRKGRVSRPKRLEPSALDALGRSGPE